MDGVIISVLRTYIAMRWTSDGLGGPCAIIGQFDAGSHHMPECIPDQTESKLSSIVRLSENPVDRLNV